MHSAVNLSCAFWQRHEMFILICFNVSFHLFLKNFQWGYMYQGMGVFLVSHTLHCQCGCSNNIVSSQKETGRLLLLFYCQTNRLPNFWHFLHRSLCYMHKINEKGRKRSGFSFCPFKRTFSHMEEKWGFWLHIFSSHLTRQCASSLQIASMGAYTTLFLHSLIFFVIATTH